MGGVFTAPLRDGPDRKLHFALTCVYLGGMIEYNALFRIRTTPHSPDTPGTYGFSYPNQGAGYLVPPLLWQIIGYTS